MANSWQDLIKSQAYIRGAWSDSKNKKTFEVHNPANGDIVATIADCRGEDTQSAIDAASDAFHSWKKLTGKERSKIIYSWYEAITSRIDDLAMILSLEQGKPLAEAKGEVLGGAVFVEWFAEEAKRAYGDFIPPHKDDARIIVSREPVGVVGAITPWNFPSSMITRKVAPALAAGCSVVLKPAEDTPLSALALAALAQEAGLPKGILNVVPSSEAKEVGKVLTSDERVKKISFTGSTQVGRILMQQCAPQIKKLSLELGGNAPFIVTGHADLDKAVAGAMACKFRNAGQTCISANRIYVHESVFEAFSTAFVEKVQALKLGAGDQEGSEIGPLINKAGFEKVAGFVEDAKSKGADILCGGEKAGESGALFYQPTVLTNISQDMDLSCQEIFGPVAALYPYKDMEEVIEKANDTEYGLASYIYSDDYKEIWALSEALEYGMVAVNEPMLATELAPFGGVKQSGIGREGSKYGLEEFTEIKYRLLGGL